MADLSDVVDNTTLTPAELSTTFSVTLESTRSRSSSYRDPLDVTREELEKKQLLHNIELLKLELSQKQLIIDTAQNEQASQIEELKEVLADAQHEKKLLSLRVQSLSHGYEQELKRVREQLQEERARAEREGVAQSDTQLELSEVREEIVVALTTSLPLKDAQYQVLKSADPTTLPIKNLIQLHMYEFASPLQQCQKELQQSITSLNQQLESKEVECALTKQSLLEIEERARSEEQQCTHLRHDLKMMEMQVLEGNYKVDNFDAVKRERDLLKTEVEKLQGQLAVHDLKEQRGLEELETLTKELSSVQQSEALLQQDKCYLGNQVSDLTHKLTLAEERLLEMNTELNSAKQVKEDLYKQLIKAREEKHVECDRKLESELSGVKARTALEMDQLRTQTREMYERENRVLSEARTAAVVERDKAKAAEKELSEKYEHLLKDFHTLQASSDKRAAELQGQLQVVRFEREHIGILHQETARDLKRLQLEQEKHQKKVEVLTQEVWSVESGKEAQVKGLESELCDVKQRLQGYENIENELESIVMQSAQMEHSCDAERVVASYGFGATLPTQSKWRLQQSVQLARRVLQLEKINSSLRSQLQTEEKQLAEGKKELESKNQLLKDIQQPSAYLGNRVLEQEKQAQKSMERVAQLEAELAAVKKEKASLIKANNQMSADLERLLDHREELRVMKAVLLGQDKPNSLVKMELVPPPPSRSSPHQRHPSPYSTQPHPTVFTKQFQ